MRSKGQGRYAGVRSRMVPLLCAVVLTAGGVLAARGISDHMRMAETASRFRISSNYLTEDGSACYTVRDWGDGFDILLYNYDKEDASQIASAAMTYTATAENAAVSVWKQSGTAVPASADSTYTFDPTPMNAYHLLHVTPDADAAEDDMITVTVQTTAPCEKILTAAFQVQRYRQPDYTITDQGNSVLLTVHTNDYEDSMTVSWAQEKYAPDVYNALLDSWSGDAPIVHFPVTRESTCELLFFKRTDDVVPQLTGSATVITIN